MIFFIPIFFYVIDLNAFFLFCSRVWIFFFLPYPRKFPFCISSLHCQSISFKQKHTWMGVACWEGALHLFDVVIRISTTSRILTQASLSISWRPLTVHCDLAAVSLILTQMCEVTQFFALGTTNAELANSIKHRSLKSTLRMSLPGLWYMVTAALAQQ